MRHSTKSYPEPARLAAFDVMRTIGDEESAEQLDLNRQMKNVLAKRTAKTRATPAAQAR